MIEYFILYFLMFVLIFLISYYLILRITPKLIKIIIANKFVGKDMNKLNKPLVAELGGLPVIISFIFSILISFLFYIIFFKNLLILDIGEFFIILASMCFIFFLGFIDDILGWKKGISQWQHFLFPIILCIPIIVYTIYAGYSTIYIPFLGLISVGLIYSWVFVPVALTATTNSFNLLAGYNGLEVGLGIIIFSTISLFSLLTYNFTLLIILAAWLGALVGFLKFNKFPSKIFPGDIITLANGFFAGVCAIILKMELLIAFLILLYIIEFIIKAKHNFKTECFGVIQKNKIILPNPKGGSLIHLVLKRGKFTEKKLVNRFYIFQIIISLFSVLFFFIFYF